MQIGTIQLANTLLAAPMAGVTDRPFRQLCRALGAGLAVSEMVTSDTRLWHTGKSRRRMDHAGENEPRSVQIAGADPQMMAEAAAENAARGAQLIDINMGCPAKKVCNRMAGSALLADEDLVARILDAVVAAVDVPVTLKIRTGPSPDARNGVRIAELAERSGIQALAVHGRTRACAFKGDAEYATIAEIKRAVTIPVIANGDIDTPARAREVLRVTGADGLMIGRAAQGRPWIFREIAHYLATGETLPAPAPTEVRDILLGHLENLYAFYGVELGVRVARKHIGWYASGQPGAAVFRQSVMRVESAREQFRQVQGYFDRLAVGEVMAA